MAIWCFGVPYPSRALYDYLRQRERTMTPGELMPTDTLDNELFADFKRLDVQIAVRGTHDVGVADLAALRTGGPLEKGREVFLAAKCYIKDATTPLKRSSQGVVDYADGKLVLELISVTGIDVGEMLLKPAKADRCPECGVTVGTDHMVDCPIRKKETVYSGDGGADFKDADDNPDNPDYRGEDAAEPVQTTVDDFAYGDGEDLNDGEPIETDDPDDESPFR